jgi:general secretion pathway protein I
MRAEARAARGFTLLEVLVALAVVALALSAAVTAAGQNVRNVALLRDRTLAHWVAMDRIAELQLSGDWAGPGKREGDTVLAGHEWHWSLAISTTDDSDVQRLDVEVRRSRDDERVIDSMIAYLGRPRQ